METNAEMMKERVAERYAAIAHGEGCNCGENCCGSGVGRLATLDYRSTDARGLESAASASLGCGNPGAIAALRPGETVLDLGSGGGFDCFLAARAVGPNGRVIGVDMTPEMIRLARRNAAKAGTSNVEFRLGDIEHLPVADSSVDVVISNCVINLVPEKAAVFREVFRVLRPGGRLAVADVVARKPLPAHIRDSVAAQVGCIAGAATTPELAAWLAGAGFIETMVEPRNLLPEGTFGDGSTVGGNANDWISRL